MSCGRHCSGSRLRSEIILKPELSEYVGSCSGGLTWRRRQPPAAPLRRPPTVWSAIAGCTSQDRDQDPSHRRPVGFMVLYVDRQARVLSNEGLRLILSLPTPDQQPVKALSLQTASHLTGSSFEVPITCIASTLHLKHEMEARAWRGGDGSHIVRMWVS